MPISWVLPTAAPVGQRSDPELCLYNRRPRLVRRLAADNTPARAVRIRLELLLAYLAMPIDLIPDFVPIPGYANDAIIIKPR